MMSFNDYWKEKAAKRHKSWASKARRYKENHTPLEKVRKEVFQPMDYYEGFRIEDYKIFHYVAKNPAIKWKDGAFSFDQEGLITALKAEGADLANFKYESIRESIVGQEVPQKKFWGKSLEVHSRFINWFRRIYEICTTVERVHIRYSDITMVINRYTSEDNPFAYYELIPSNDLIAGELLLEETSFYSLNVATLLMELAAEKELQQEAFKYFAKSLKLSQMEAAVIDSVKFDLWDDKKIEKKLKEYAAKNYSTEDVLYAVLRPLKMGVKKYLEAMTARCSNKGGLVPDYYFDWNRYLQTFIDNTLQPYIKESGLQDVTVSIPDKRKGILFNYQGYNVFLCKGFCFYPFPKEKDLESSRYTYVSKSYISLSKISLSAIVGYLKQMPAINARIDKVKEKVRKRYSEIKASK